MKSTAIANANIALVKYWGKRDNKLLLPFNSSISMTCEGLTTTTTVEFSDKYKKDQIIINDEELKKDEKNVIEHLNRIRKRAGVVKKAKVVSQSNFPIAAGLASSASGFAALTLAASKALGMDLGERELSILARQGSGSAARSISEGFVEWHKGEKKDGSDSYAYTIAGKKYWHEFRMLVTIVKEEKKKLSSRAGMQKTVETSPYYKGWLEDVEEDLENLKKGISKRNFSAVGRISEDNCLKMHSLMLTTKPPIIYWMPETIKIIHEISAMRDEGIECYFTIDAGPNVKILCLEKAEKKITKRLLGMKEVKRIISTKPGEGVKLTDKHLF